jgi:outer membrane protein OmpA-like peptidoglycan-associated protein
MTRRGGVRIYDVTDRHGRLLYRYRRYPGGREVMLIDNRRYYRRNNDRTRDILIGAGIGLVVGSAIALAAPEVRIPRDEYIVDYGRATDDDIYEALIAPPIERLDRGYSLEEIRYSRYLRDRMRRVDLDTVTFDFGSWEVAPDQERALDRMAEGINRALERNPDEIFMIEGHTDAVGAEEDNLMLSDRRAQSVAEILTTAYGVPPENLITQGYGEEQLKIPTDGPERANRRITVRRIGPLLTGRADEGPGGPEGPDGPDGPYEDDR